MTVSDRYLGVGRSVEEPESSPEAVGQAEMLEAGEEAGCGDEVGVEAA